MLKNIILLTKIVLKVQRIFSKDTQPVCSNITLLFRFLKELSVTMKNVSSTKNTLINKTLSYLPIIESLFTLFEREREREIAQSLLKLFNLKKKTHLKIYFTHLHQFLTITYKHIYTLFKRLLDIFFKKRQSQPVEYL